MKIAKRALQAARKSAHVLLHRVLKRYQNGADQAGMANVPTREQWLERVLAEIPAGSRILDAGAGEQQYKRFCKTLKYVSQDIAEYDGTGDSVGLQTGKWKRDELDIVCDIVNIPEPDGSFDAVMCIEVLEHVPDPVAALREMTRLLRVGGTLIVTAPFCSMTHFSPYFYHTGFSRNYYEYWLPKLGLDIRELEANGNYFEYAAQQLQWLEGFRTKYTNADISDVDREALKVVLGLLGRLSRADRNSAELLNFGLHVKAVKLP